MGLGSRVHIPDTGNYNFCHIQRTGTAADFDNVAQTVYKLFTTTTTITIATAAAAVAAATTTTTTITTTTAAAVAT